MEILQKMKNALVGTAIIYIILGIVMLLIPKVVSDFICYIIGALFLVLGLSGIFSYIKVRTNGSLLSLTLIISILFAALGIYIICNPLAFASFIPLVVGMMLIIGSINKFQTAYDLKKLDSGASVKVLILAILTIVFGIILVFNPFASVTLFIRIIGALLIFDGLSNLYSIYSYSKVK